MKEINFDDVLIQPKRSHIKSRGDISLYNILNQKPVIPIINANMTQTGSTKVATEMLKNSCMATLHKFYKNSEIVRFFNKCNLLKLDTSNLFITFGLKEIEKMKEFATISNEYDFSILLDVPNGYISSFTNLIRECRKLFPNRYIMAGNICDSKGAYEIFKAGADCVKVGINPGSACRTRQTTGCGRKQLSAILDCAKIAKKYNKHICADGGCKEVADICKAFVAGADCVMLGGMLASSKEAGLHTKKIDGKTYNEFYGMSSFRAQKENYGKTTKTGTSEGEECILIEQTGVLKNILDKIFGGIRSCCSYTASTEIKKLKKAKFFI